MFRTCSSLSVVLALAGWTLSARAQDDDVRSLVLKAQKAHGGKAALTKHLGVQVKFKGDVDANGVQAKIEGEVSYNYPERMKNVMTLDINNMKIQLQQGYDGKVLWLSVMGMTQEIKDKESIAEMRHSMYSEQVTSLADIESKDYELSALGEMKIKGKEAVGVRVSKKDKRDVNLWLDKTTHLIVKTEFRGKDPFGQAGEANQEKYFADYKAVSGLQMPRHVEVHNDGKKIVEMELSDVRYYEKLDDSHFNRP